MVTTYFNLFLCLSNRNGQLIPGYVFAFQSPPSMLRHGMLTMIDNSLLIAVITATYGGQCLAVHAETHTGCTIWQSMIWVSSLPLSYLEDCPFCTSLFCFEFFYTFVYNSNLLVFNRLAFNKCGGTFAMLDIGCCYQLLRLSSLFFLLKIFCHSLIHVKSGKIGRARSGKF